MDGNGRWAKSKGLPRLEGHRKGVETVEEIVETVRDLKIPYLTLYAFSDENWRRPEAEITALMVLLEDYLKSKQEKMIKNGIRFRAIGDLAKLPERVRAVVQETIEKTKEGKEMALILALSYGSRNEIVRAVERMMRDHEGPWTMDHGLGEVEIAKYLDTKDFPDPDLLIRTSGEYRLSNFLLWQLAYTELIFTKTMWPDFTPTELHKALEEYSRRERRFGKISEQLVR